jgi:hypothetical protein
MGCLHSIKNVQMVKMPQDTCVVILTIPKNMKFAKQVQKHLQFHHFPKPMIKSFPSAPSGSTNKQMLQNASENHFKIIKWFHETQKKSKHLVVCEDDCEMLKGDPCWNRINQYLEYLDEHYPNWVTFHIGHCPIGPIFPTQHSSLVYSTMPYMAHCYALNRANLTPLLRQYPHAKIWIRPFAIEGWSMVPWKCKFAVYPMLATQNRMPREVKNVKIVHKIGLPKCLIIVEHTMMYGLSGVVLLVVILLLLRICLRK